MRVARDELRVFPLVSMGSVVHPHLDQLLDQLFEKGGTVDVVDVDYEFQVGGDQMLVLRHQDH
jgi:hypothetical protein